MLPGNAFVGQLAVRGVATAKDEGFVHQFPLLGGRAVHFALDEVRHWAAIVPGCRVVARQKSRRYNPPPCLTSTKRDPMPGRQPTKPRWTPANGFRTSRSPSLPSSVTMKSWEK